MREISDFSIGDIEIQFHMNFCSQQAPCIADQKKIADHNHDGFELKFHIICPFLASLGSPWQVLDEVVNSIRHNLFSIAWAAAFSSLSVSCMIFVSLPNSISLNPHTWERSVAWRSRLW